MRKIAALLVPALVLASCGGDDECSGSCLDSFVVTLGGVQAEAGDYVVTAVADGEQVVCQLTIPDREPREPIACSNPAVTLTLGPAQTLGQLIIAGKPQQVQVAVLRNGSPVVEGSFQPQYQDVRLAAGCPVACSQATAPLSTPGLETGG